ncbi:MAG TPA: c-type cytochrome [Bryobacteraceae bacterium]|nr:c-type cytochrome [Bryobacteraceae bacterium]
MFRVVCALMTLAAGFGYAQPGSPDADTGKQLYQVNCSNCHGPDGNFVSGVDLMHGKFRHASTDNELVAIMKQGISGTPMPPANLTDAQAHSIVAYLRQRAEENEAGTSNAAEIARGRAIFQSKGCENCHRVNGKGSRVGPDLSDIGALRMPAEIERSILDPNAEILAENRYVRAVTRDGTTITGRILNEDTFSLQLIDSHENLVSLSKAGLREYSFLKNSPMPSFRGKLSSAELADLIAYLASLKGL